MGNNKAVYEAFYEEARTEIMKNFQNEARDEANNQAKYVVKKYFQENNTKK